MEYKTPKTLEKTPLVGGYPVISVIIIIICLMLFIFIVFKNVLVSLIFLMAPAIYLYTEKKFPRRGEFKEFLEYKLGMKCIRFNEKLENIINIHFDDASINGKE